MKLIAVILIACLSLAFADDDKCLDKVHDFLKCAKTQINETERDSIGDDLKSKTKKCFQDSGCSQPNLKNFTLPGGLAAQLAEIPSSVKKCLKHKLFEKLGTFLNDCLTKKGLKNVNISDVASTLESAATEFAAEEHSELHNVIAAKIAVAKGVSACASEKFGGDTAKVKPLEQCLHDGEKTIKPRICNDLKPCITTLPSDCKKRGEEIHKAVCQCKKEKESEIAGKLATLGKQDRVPIKDLVSAALDDQEIADIIKQVDSCYTENSEEEPPILQLAIKALAKGGDKDVKSTVSLSISGQDVTILSDSLLLEANDASECEPCQ